MRRILVIHCPSVRSAPGSSFGPITTSATTPMRSNSPQPMSNMGQTPRGARRPRSSVQEKPGSRKTVNALDRAAFEPLLGLGARLEVGGGLMIDGLQRLGLGGLGLDLL